MDGLEWLSCHACGEDWVRDSHYDSSLLCPSCGSDFVQIIEESSPPERDSFPRSPPLNAFSNHNPWSEEEAAAAAAEEEDSPSHHASAAYNPMDFAFPGFSHHTYRSPDGRFNFSGTTVRGSFPLRQGGTYSNPMIPMLQTLQTILGDMSETHDTESNSNQHQDHHSPHRHQRSSRFEASPRQQSPDPDHTGLDQFVEFGELFPRNSDRPQRMAPPVESLADLLGDFHYNSGPRRRSGRPHPRMQTGPDPVTMLGELMREMHEIRSTGRFGDAVYSREALDEVIAQISQQDPHAQGGGAPPASNTAIQLLPKKKVNKDMLGADGKAECAICKDTVELNTEVTMLPCEHWFHFDCIEAWLSRHNTCPNCRRSISSTSPGEGTSDPPVNSQDNPEQEPGRRRRRSSPFSRSSRSGRSSFSRSSANSPTQESNGPTRSRRTSRSEGHHRGGITGWVWSRFGGGSG